MIVQILFICLCFLADGVLIVLLPHSFLPGSIVITPCLGLSALVLMERKMDFKDSFLLFIIFGLLYDIFISNSLLACTISFAIVSLLVFVWQKHLTESVLESSLLVIVTIFVKEFLIYFMMTLLKETLMSFDAWLTSRAVFTILVNGIFVVSIVWVSRTIEDMRLLREKRIRKEETISWWKISSKR